MATRYLTEARPPAAPDAPPAPAPAPAPARRPGWRWSTAAWFLGSVGLVALLFVAARAAAGGTSDDATIVLEGQAIASGHLALGGWSLSYDSFWTLETPLYGLVGGLFGFGQYLMWLVPAVLAVLLVLTAVWLAGGGRRPGSWLAAAVVLAMLGLPSPVLSYFLLQAGWHVATTLFALLAFAGAVRSRSRLGLAGAVVAVAAALLGDLLAVALVVLPLVLAGLVAITVERSWRAGARQLGAALGGGLLAIVVRLVAVAAGTYSVTSRDVLASPQQILSNLASLPGRLAGLGGLTSFVSGVAAGPVELRLGRLLLLALALWALAEALRSLLRALRAARRRQAASGRAAQKATRHPATRHPATRHPAAPSERRMLDDLLALGVLGSLGTYALFATSSTENFGRYLLPAYAFGAVLAARATGRLLGGRPRRSARAVTGVGAAVVLLSAAGFGAGSLGPAAPQPARQLAAFLGAHGLRNGVGDYWSSSILTVDSGGQVSVRPVNLSTTGTLVRYDRQSSAAWYRGQSFAFFVYDSAAIWQGVDAAAAQRTFGPPARTYAVGSYRVLVYSRPVQVSPALLPQTPS